MYSKLVFLTLLGVGFLIFYTYLVCMICNVVFSLSSTITIIYGLFFWDDMYMYMYMYDLVF